MKLHGNVRKRLADARNELVQTRESLRIVDEQVAFQQGVAADTEIRAVVASTPLADREHREAVEDLQRLRHQSQELRNRAAALTAEQDALLDRLLQQSREM